VAERWATFDCYGTIVDWNAGIRGELEKLFGIEHADWLLARYHALESEIQAANPGHSYREVLTIALERLADEEGLSLPEGEASALAHSLPSWPVFEDAHASLVEAKDRGWRLAILSNTDRDLIEASMEAIAVAFDDAIVSGDIGSYKPSPGHWKVFRERHGGDVEHVHVAQSLFHDIAPTSDLGIPNVWINRLGESDDSRADRTLGSLAGLADVLDDLVAERAR
jgi:2-haloacid dehalogenase